MIPSAKNKSLLKDLTQKAAKPENKKEQKLSAKGEGMLTKAFEK
jgi:hypothetical protein